MSEPTITHYVGKENNISAEEAVKLGLPIRAACGFTWVPKYANTPKIRIVSRLSNFQRSGRLARTRVEPPACKHEKPTPIFQVTPPNPPTESRRTS